MDNELSCYDPFEWRPADYYQCLDPIPHDDEERTEITEED
jgi:hypothetical protein